MNIEQLKRDADNNIVTIVDIVDNPVAACTSRDPVLVKSYGVPTCYIIPADDMERLLADAEKA